MDSSVRLIMYSYADTCWITVTEKDRGMLRGIEVFWNTKRAITWPCAPPRLACSRRLPNLGTTLLMAQTQRFCGTVRDGMEGT
jgi:hypothetical protein